MDLSGSLSSHRDAITNITLRLTNGHEGRSIWLDDIRYVSNYLTDPAASSNVTSTLQQYIQYKAIFSTYDGNVSSWLSEVELSYQVDVGPTNEQLMRHGKWFDGGIEQPYWWTQ